MAKRSRLLKLNLLPALSPTKQVREATLRELGNGIFKAMGDFLHFSDSSIHKSQMSKSSRGFTDGPSIQLRESIHEHNLKDAIQRQELRKAEREKAKLEQEVKALEDKVTRLMKTKEADERYLQKQETELCSLKAKAEAPSPALVQRQVESLKGELQAGKLIFKTIKGLYEKEISLYVQTQEDRNKRSVESLRQLLERSEEHLAVKQQIAAELSALAKQSARIAEVQRAATEDELEEVRTLRLQDQRLLLEQERTLTQYRLAEHRKKEINLF